jgi:hypothetical protein
VSFGGQIYTGAGLLLVVAGVEGGAEITCVFGTGGFAGVVTEHGFASGVCPVISEGDEGRSQSCLFCLHAKAFNFFST